MQLPNWVNSFQYLPVEEAARRVAGAPEGAEAAAFLRALGPTLGGVAPWLGEPLWTCHYVNTVLRQASDGCPTPELTLADLVRGFVANFAARSNPDGSAFVALDALPCDWSLAAADNPNGPAFLLLDPAVPEGPRMPPPAPGGRCVALRETASDFIALFLKQRVGTLMLRIDEDAEAAAARVEDFAGWFVHDAFVIAHGRPADYHGFLAALQARFHEARLWGMTTAPGDGGGLTVAVHSLGDPAKRSPKPGPVSSPAPEVDAAPGLARRFVFTPRERLAEIADHSRVVRPARRVALRRPAFIWGPESLRETWRWSFGGDPDSWLDRSEMEMPAMTVARFDDLRIFGNAHAATRDGRIFESSQRELDEEHFLRLSPQWLSDAVREPDGAIVSARASRIAQVIDEDAVFIGSPGLPMHFHFLFDVAARLWHADQIDVEDPWIVVTAQTGEEQIEALHRYFGVPRGRLVRHAPWAGATLLRRGHVNPSPNADNWFAPEPVDFVASRAALGRFPSGEDRGRLKRIFVGRSDVERDRRRLANEAALARRLAAMGFVEVVPSAYEFGEEMALFENADEIVFVFGSAVANAVFCRPDARILLLQPDSCSWRGFFTIMALRGHRFGAVFGEAFRRYERAHNTEWIIDVDLVSRAVETLRAG